MTTSHSLSVETLGRITVLQSMVTLMPNKISMLDFVCQGLKDVTGVKNLAYRLFDGCTPPPIDSTRSAETMRIFPIKYNAVTYAELNFEIADSEAFEPYMPFLQNFVNMLGVVFEGQTQRKLNETLLEELEQRVAERTSELQEKKEDLRITLNSIGDAVISTDIYGNVTNMNPVAEKLTGWKIVDGIGRHLTDVFNIVNVVTLQPALNPVKRVLATGEIVGLANHTSLIAKDGTHYQIADSAAPIRDIDGSICGVVLVFRDVTEEYRIAEALKSSEEKYREIVERTGDLVTSVDKNGMFTYVNHCAEKIFGLPVAQCLGKFAFEWVHPDDREKTAKWFDDCISNHLEQSSFENRQINQITQDIFQLHWTSSFHYDDKGRLLWVNGLAHDITELKHREEERRSHIRFLESLEQGAGPWQAAGISRVVIVTEFVAVVGLIREHARNGMAKFFAIVFSVGLVGDLDEFFYGLVAEGVEVGIAVVPVAATLQFHTEHNQLFACGQFWGRFTFCDLANLGGGDAIDARGKGGHGILGPFQGGCFVGDMRNQTPCTVFRIFRHQSAGGTGGPAVFVIQPG